MLRYQLSLIYNKRLVTVRCIDTLNIQLVIS